MGSTRNAIAAVAATAILAALAPSASHAQTIEMVRVKDAGALADPAAAGWEAFPAAVVMLLPQSVTTPAHPIAAVDELEVKAIHDGKSYAFRMEWRDSTRSDRMVTDEFGDQIALQLPMRYEASSVPSPMMGNPGGRVSILQWRAAFQRDIEYGAPTVRDLYPNALVDVYPDEVLAATDAKPYTGALSVDNPISRGRASPVLDQMAEGWGTMTVKAEQHADGRGLWQDGVWHVVISHPMKNDSDNDPQLAAGGKTIAAFAVWDGGSGEVGSRKAWANWVSVQVSE